jgi:S-DNA-T family DNA segregation ATPase FtsK/SpoIIIE
MRIAFKVPTGVDSRVIIDESGAENLLGKGDLLYKLFENQDIKRAHGAFVQTADIARICIQHNDIRKSLQDIRDRMKVQA